MKRVLILLAFIAAFVLAFSLLEGFMLIIALVIIFPLFFFYCPLIFAGDSKRDEKTEEAKREDEGRFGKWY